ncbi:HD domain-containing protein [Xanthomonas sacchari]|uniref:HD domain-containing protein n=1 Tax=Xanthomonas sacchari TaxID=56458 RepID=UPI00225E2106|nr:HD domain-containing protein [Xanthomonas sacchari]
MSACGEPVFSIDHIDGVGSGPWWRMAGLNAPAHPLVQRAYEFAKAAHEAVGQKCKYTREDYISHPVAVANIVQGVPHTAEMMAVALLHDTIEDTHVTRSDLLRAFGAQVAELVQWLTNVAHEHQGNRLARKQLERDHLADAPAEAHTIKLADVIVNTRSIVDHDRRFAAVYLVEKAHLLEALNRGDRTLWHEARRHIQLGSLRLGLKLALPAGDRS